jgi:hypothetical protein
MKALDPPTGEHRQAGQGSPRLPATPSRTGLSGVGGSGAVVNRSTTDNPAHTSPSVTPNAVLAKHCARRSRKSRRLAGLKQREIESDELQFDVDALFQASIGLWSLPRAVESCCQTQIIVADDGSTGGTWIGSKGKGTSFQSGKPIGVRTLKSPCGPILNGPDCTATASSAQKVFDTLVRTLFRVRAP